MLDKINSHICLMLSVYKSFHPNGQYGRQRDHILQDLIGFKYKFLWRPVKPKTGLNIPSLKRLKFGIKVQIA